VILECRPELTTTFCHSGVATKVIAFGEEIPPADFCHLRDQPSGMLGFTLEKHSRQTPY